LEADIKTVLKSIIRSSQTADNKSDLVKKITQEVRPNDNPEYDLPPDQLSIADCEKPADKPDDSSER
jgi:hypothetical protein